MTGDTLYLADTNVLIRLANQEQPDYPLVRRATKTLQGKGIELAFTLQNMTEFWNVSTRPIERNGFGMTVAECERSVSNVERGMIFLPDNDAVYQQWRRIVFQHKVSGVQVHDAPLAASMLAHGVTHILTFNVADLTRFDGITAVHPATVEREFSSLP